MEMMHPCLLCFKHASRVCIHPNCDKIPFICDNQCVYNYNLAIKLHTHNQQQSFASYSQVKDKVQQIKRTIDLQQHINKIRKEINLIIGDINYLIDTYENQMKKRPMRLKEKVKATIDKFDGPTKNTTLFGKHIGYMLNQKNILDDQCSEQKQIIVAKNQMEKIIISIKNLNLRQLAERLKIKGQKMSTITNQEELNLQKAHQYFENALLLSKKGQIQNKKAAVVQFDKAINLDLNNFKYYFFKGNLLSCLNQQQQAILSYTKSLKLQPKAADILNNRGNSYFKLQKYKEAIQDFSSAILLKQRKLYYNNRSDVYRVLSKQKPYYHIKEQQDLKRAAELNQ